MKIMSNIKNFCQTFIFIAVAFLFAFLIYKYCRPYFYEVTQEELVQQTIIDMVKPGALK